jgi:hypothetical protein
MSILILIVGYLVCGLMMVNAIIIKHRALREIEKAIYIRNLFLLRKSGRLFLRNRTRR